MSKKNKNKQNVITNSTTSSVSQTLSNEDRSLLELAKRIVQEGDTELKNLINKLAEKANEDYKIELELEKEEFVKNLDKQFSEKKEELQALNNDIKQLESEKDQLETEKDIVEKEKIKLEQDRKNFELDCKRKGQAKVDLIFKEEKEKFLNDQKELKAQLDDISNKRKKLDEEIERKENEIAAKKKALANERKMFEEDMEDDKAALERTKEKLLKREAEFNKANPEKIDELEDKIERLNKSLEVFKNENQRLNNEKNSLELARARSEGYKIEDLQQEISILSEQLEKQKDEVYKLNSRTSEKESEYQKRIEKLEIINSEKDTKLIKYENERLQYEQLKEQSELLRTLNDNLRKELINTKNMLESHSGDICEALTDIDSKEEAEKTTRKEYNISLYELANHIKNYASNNRSLFYSINDIKAFIAGLYASKLSILQGMSGTGKSSLPVVFMESIMGVCDTIPVESSWRDRNELLGYYNDFSKVFTATKFTCSLYRANTVNYNKYVPYFIVLDEMNLSRIEYYFSDFLSVLEKEDSDDWKIELTKKDMRQLPNEITDDIRKAIENDDKQRLKESLNKVYNSNNSIKDDFILDPSDKQELLSFFKQNSNLMNGPRYLIEGKSLQIPENVWFIGTANKDESTFEITDKVYDRAQVINFSKRAENEKHNVLEEKKFVSYKTIKQLFINAEHQYSFDCEKNEIVNKIDNFLREKFQISFGNRIVDQINKFVPVYIASSFANNYKPSKDDVLKMQYEALDYQITNKVLRKLEYIDIDKNTMAELEKLFSTDRYKMSFALNFLNTKKAN